MSFTASTYQNEFLPAGATEVHAVVTITAGADVATASSAEKAVVLIVDTSGSMTMPASKIHAARRSIATAVGLIPDGVRFAIISGSEKAECVYPSGGQALAVADPATRDAAHDIAVRLSAEGGTAISTWLAMARGLFEPLPGAIRLAYLLTDGKNEHEERSALTDELARCTGVFQCDARGVGEKWVVEELRLVTSALLGELDIVAEPDEMDDDFTAFLERAIGKQVADVGLRLWTPQGSTVRFVKQVAPSIEELTGKAAPVDERSSEYPTGAWAAGESRDYHVCIDIPAGHVGEERLGARVGLAVDGDVQSQALVRAVWTDDEALSARINPQVAHYTGQAELAGAIHEGLEARKAGDDATATLRLGRAVQLAHESGNEGTVRLLNKVVEVEDAEKGTVRLRKGVGALDEMALDTRSTRTVRVTKK